MEMIGSILQMSAIRGGKLKLNKTTFLLKELIEDAWKEIQHRTVQKRISHKLTIEPAVSLNADRNRFQQVLQNLYTNAIKFSHPNSTVETLVIQKQDQTIIEVKDNGVGMTEKQAKSIFDSAKTTSTLGTGGETGTGYGLPLVEQIIELHHGTIELDTCLNQGSTFKITI